ncbi:hypothetical protein DERP_009756 [Dermatophagoides pteronyssinus]|uniref:Uncharacterized protein n=1 Tax=Dermatophagoides pteronyssinus TaxID=6956 RepID=A0ABQ8IR23_DERPT|nr:hypothetical protein DERP_009756 [Dermatophagoides pteronyssinus]
MSREKCLKILIRLLILLAISSSILITISIMITLIDILLFVDFNKDNYHLNMNPLFYWSIFMINFFILISIIFTWKNLFQISNEYYIQCYLMPMEKLKFFQCFHSLMFIIMAIFIFYLIIRQLFIAYDEGKKMEKIQILILLIIFACQDLLHFSISKRLNQFLNIICDYHRNC